jgi:hypothetical protein
MSLNEDNTNTVKKNGGRTHRSQQVDVCIFDACMHVLARLDPIARDEHAAKSKRKEVLRGDSSEPTRSCLPTDQPIHLFLFPSSIHAVVYVDPKEKEKPKY